MNRQVYQTRNGINEWKATALPLSTLIQALMLFTRYTPLPLSTLSAFPSPLYPILSLLYTFLFTSLYLCCLSISPFSEMLHNVAIVLIICTIYMYGQIYTCSNWILKLNCLTNSTQYGKSRGVTSRDLAKSTFSFKFISCHHIHKLPKYTALP